MILVVFFIEMEIGAVSQGINIQFFPEVSIMGNEETC